MQNLQAAERYARALLEIACAAREDAEIEEALMSLSSALLASPELEKFLSNPNVTAAERSRIVAKLFKDKKGGVTLTSFVETLFRHGRFNILHDVATVYKRISDEAQGQATVTIESAVPLSAEDERRIVANVEKIGGFKAEVLKEVDPSLIGGVVVRFNNKVLDGSVKNRIALIKKELTQRRTA
jgi:F-type H+-transporting ATPase subunit delta